MIGEFVQFVETYLIPLGAAGVFAAAFLEEVVAPIPSAAVMMTSGFFFLKGGWSPGLAKDLVLSVALPIALGVTVGSLFVYGIAYASGKPALARWGKWFGLSWKDIEAAERRLEAKHADTAAVFALRVVPIVPNVAISAISGVMRLHIGKYLAATFLGTFIRALALGAAGWQLGALYWKYAGMVDRVGDWVLYSLVALVAVAAAARLARFGRKAGA